MCVVPSADEWDASKQNDLIEILKGIGDEGREVMPVDDFAPKKGKRGQR